MAIGRAAAAGLVLTVSAAAGAAALLRARPGAGAAAPAPLEAVSRGDLELRFREVGDVAAKVSVNVASQASGRVVSLHAREGDLVAAGQRLAVVQPGRAQSERYLPSTV
ncbi:MAG TPA: biotin/lipoyl-binding protein, partial [Elusimicrobiota bacterium]|nr:biotin/lipoyl-binding protein [Elusimicrobiota bacterium]